MSDFLYLGRPELTETHEDIVVDLRRIPEGISEIDNYLLCRDKSNIKCYSRVCDHNSGLLKLVGNKAICPLHGWTFNPQTGNYDDVQVCKKPERVVIKDQSLIIKKAIKSIHIESSPNFCDHKLTLSFLGHACLLFESQQFKFATDPWIVGPAFVSGWWPTMLPVKDWITSLNSCDFIYISHNHPDHLNPNTLKYIRKDMPIVFPDFESKSVQVAMQALGFERLIPFACGAIYNLKSTGLNISILRSGDFRDDSGIYFNFGNFTFLSTVDSNMLNNNILPASPVVLASSFAGGASGYPLCFDNLSAIQKARITKRTTNAMLHTQIQLANQLKPCFFLPYAGFFKERAAMDSYIASNNKKNSVSDVASVCTHNILDVNRFDTYQFQGKHLLSKNTVDREVHLEDPQDWIEENLNVLPEPEPEKVTDYFVNSQFLDELVLFLTLCDNTFVNQYVTYRVDFSQSPPQVNLINNIDLTTEYIQAFKTNNRKLWLKVRQQAFSYLLANRLPWEDLSIGFQLRVFRVPDLYNSRFWNHFTNTYIGDRVRC